MAEAQKEYSRQEIAEDKRKTEAEKIHSEKGNLKKTAEWRAQLSEEWIKRAGVSWKQKERVLKELGISQDDSVENREKKIQKWQEENGLAKKWAWDGILWWATLEALDTKMEGDDVQYDINPDNNSDHGGALENWNRVNPKKLTYGLSRVGYHEKKDEEKKPEPKKIDEKSTEYSQNLEEQRLAIMEQRGGSNPMLVEMASKSEITDLNWKIFTIDKSGKLIEKKIIPTEDAKVVAKRNEALAGENLKKSLGNIKDWRDFLTWTWKDNKTTYGSQKIGNLDGLIKSSIWEDQPMVKSILGKTKQSYDKLSESDKWALANTTLSEFRDMTQSPEKAAKLLAPKDKPGKLPVGLGEKWKSYQKIWKETFVISEEKNEIPKVYREWKTVWVDKVFNQPGEYPLPNNQVLRVSIDGGIKKFFVAEKIDSTEPKWAVNKEWKLEEIKKAA